MASPGEAFLSEAPLRRLGVMGGTFDPIHLGHLVAASEALHEYSLDRVLFMPTGHPWQKRSSTDPEDRYLMTVLGAATNHRFAVSRMEIDRVGPTYTVETLRLLRDFHSGELELSFIIGADAALKLGTWHRAEGLEDLADIIAVTRPGFDLSELRSEPWWPRIHLLDMPAVDVSSSDIRFRVATGRPIDYLVPAEVVAYIREHGLYVTAGDDAERASA